MDLFRIVLVITGIVIAAAALYCYRAKNLMKQAKERAAWLNAELARADSRIEAVEIWSDEEIERNDCQVGNAILEEVGLDLSSDESMEAKRLRDLLAKVHDGELRTPRDFGMAWFACLQLQDKEPASELAQLFNALNHAWTAIREGQAKS